MSLDLNILTYNISIKKFASILLDIKKAGLSVFDSLSLLKIKNIIAR